MFAAAGGLYGRHKRLARTEQAIGQIPEETASKVVGKVSTVVKEEVQKVNKHIDDALAPLMKVLIHGANETVAQAKARNRFELEAIRCCEASEKEAAKQEREEKRRRSARRKEGGREGERQQAAKKQRRRLQLFRLSFCSRQPIGDRRLQPSRASIRSEVPRGA